MPRLSNTSRQRRILAERASVMRRSPTTSEARLFEALRGGRIGVPFRHQVPALGRFIVDLLAAEVRLVVEVDGLYHDARRAADARRDRALIRAGYTMLRVATADVMLDLEGVGARVWAEITRLRQDAE